MLPRRLDGARPIVAALEAANRAEHVVLIPAQIGRTLGRSVAFRGVYDGYPR